MRRLVVECQNENLITEVELCLFSGLQGHDVMGSRTVFSGAAFSGLSLEVGCAQVGSCTAAGAVRYTIRRIDGVRPRDGCAY